jgi:nitrite reductase/ring-hydroxylating ferredoxin subunit
MMRTSEWVVVANVNEILLGKMKHVEVDGREVLITNVNGKFYAINDRCGHTNARLSSGGLKGKIVTCPLHAAQFDATTGKKLADPQ